MWTKTVTIATVLHSCYGWVVWLCAVAEEIVSELLCFLLILIRNLPKEKRETKSYVSPKNMSWCVYVCCLLQVPGTIVLVVPATVYEY